MADFFGVNSDVLRYFQEEMLRTQQIVKSIQDFFYHDMLELRKVPESTKILANYGWYLPFEFDVFSINSLIDTLEENKLEFVDEELIRMFDNEMDYVEKELLNNFPTRKNPIQAAIRAHCNQEYYLSIPVFFAQTEGICKELTGKRFFSIRGEKPLTEAWASQFNGDSILSILLEPMRNTGITRKKQDALNPIGLNRHDVLHGDSIDYGIKVNSYKALSLLNYVGETVYIAKEHLAKHGLKDE